MGSETTCRGAPYSQSSGYIYTSFQKTAKVWWDPWQGGDGAIYSSIDGSGSGYPIAEVNNSSRVIKYVVTLGQRASSYTLVDVRVHDINVVADLSRHDPTAPDTDEPVDYDGTIKGTATPEPEATFQTDLDKVNAELQLYWTGPWPELHFVRERPPDCQHPEVEPSFHGKRDLLDQVTVLQFDTGSEWTDDDDREFWGEALEELAPFILFTSFLAACLLAIRFIEGTAGLGFISGAGAFAVAMWVCAIVSLRISVDAWLASGAKGLGWAAWVYFLLGMGCLGTLFGLPALAWLGAVVVSLVFPPAIWFIWEMAQATVIGSLAIRIVLLVTGLLLLSFAAQCRVGVF